MVKRRRDLTKSAGRTLLRAVGHLDRRSGVARNLALNGRLPESVWRRLPVDGVFEVSGSDRTQPFTYASSPFDSVGRVLYFRGLMGYEPETMSVWVDLARSANVIWDVGANTGVYALAACAAASNARVTALEPVPAVFGMLLRNLRENRWEGRVKAIRAAVGAESGEATLFVPTGSAVPKSASMAVFRDLATTKHVVPVVTLDELLGLDGVPDLIKIDVENAEYLVLAGAGRTLTFGPDIVLECNPDGDTALVEGTLRRANYSFLALRPHATWSNEIVPDPTETYRNFLARRF